MSDPLPSDAPCTDPVAPAPAAALMSRRFRGYLPVATKSSPYTFYPA